jgi:hypothetical protein
VVQESIVCSSVFIGANDADLLPIFLSHYRLLGVSSFHPILHGDWSGRRDSLISGRSIAISSRSINAVAAKIRQLVAKGGSHLRVLSLKLSAAPWQTKPAQRSDQGFADR